MIHLRRPLFYLQQPLLGHFRRGTGNDLRGFRRRCRCHRSGSLTSLPYRHLGMVCLPHLRHLPSLYKLPLNLCIRETPPRHFRIFSSKIVQNIFSFLNVRIVPEYVTPGKNTSKYFNSCSICGRIAEAETQKGEAHMKKGIKQCHSNLYMSKINMYATSSCYQIPLTSSLCHGILSRSGDLSKSEK
jgi:hypothetical protein